jgi:hypothetical protein
MIVLVKQLGVLANCRMTCLTQSRHTLELGFSIYTSGHIGPNEPTTQLIYTDDSTSKLRLPWSDGMDGCCAYLTSDLIGGTQFVYIHCDPSTNLNIALSRPKDDSNGEPFYVIRYTGNSALEQGMYLILYNFRVFGGIRREVYALRYMPSATGYPIDLLIQCGETLEFAPNKLIPGFPPELVVDGECMVSFSDVGGSLGVTLPNGELSIDSGRLIIRETRSILEPYYWKYDKIGCDATAAATWSNDPIVLTLGDVVHYKLRIKTIESVLAAPIASSTRSRSVRQIEPEFVISIARQIGQEHTIRAADFKKNAIFTGILVGGKKQSSCMIVDAEFSIAGGELWNLVFSSKSSASRTINLSARVGSVKYVCRLNIIFYTPADEGDMIYMSSGSSYALWSSDMHVDRRSLYFGGNPIVIAPVEGLVGASGTIPESTCFSLVNEASIDASSKISHGSQIKIVYGDTCREKIIVAVSPTEYAKEEMAIGSIGQFKCSMLAAKFAKTWIKITGVSVIDSIGKCTTYSTLEDASIDGPGCDGITTVNISYLDANVARVASVEIEWVLEAIRSRDIDPVSSEKNVSKLSKFRRQVSLIINPGHPVEIIKLLDQLRREFDPTLDVAGSEMTLMCYRDGSQDTDLLAKCKITRSPTTQLAKSIVLEYAEPTRDPAVAENGYIVIPLLYKKTITNRLDY